eukprot:365157-Chlamydomonas_euryale.AAC.33
MQGKGEIPTVRKPAGRKASRLKGVRQCGRHAHMHTRMEQYAGSVATMRVGHEVAASNPAPTRSQKYQAVIMQPNDAIIIRSNSSSTCSCWTALALTLPAPIPSKVPTIMSGPSLVGAQARHVGCEAFDIDVAKLSARVTSCNRPVRTSRLQRWVHRQCLLLHVEEDRT